VRSVERERERERERKEGRERRRGECQPVRPREKMSHFERSAIGSFESISLAMYLQQQGG
jgi:hypothetical protein